MPNRKVVLLWVFFMAFVPAAIGQGQDSKEEAAKPVALKRFYFGAHLSILGIPLTRAASYTRATSSPAYKLENTGTRTGSRWGTGASVQFNFNRRFSLNMNLLHHDAGYKTDLQVTYGVDNPKTATDERSYYKSSEITHADYWDLAALARIYYGPRAGGRFQRFLDIGPAYRRMSNIRTSREITNVDASTCCSEIPATPVHKAVPGVVIGAGIQAVDDFGIKVTPEVRYTRWLWNAVDVTAARSNKNQVEFVIGVSF